MGPTIVEKENTDENLRRLAAQREMYSLSKRLFTVQIILTTVVVVFLAGLNTFTQLQIDAYIAVYCVLVTLLDVAFLNDFIASLKERAASIQEQFDTDVLDISWNSLVKPEIPEVVCRYSDKYKKKYVTYESLENWYSVEIANIHSEAAKIVCKRSNCSYDFSLRKKFLVALCSLPAVAIVLIILFEVLNGGTLREFFNSLIFPLLPVLVFFISRIKEHNQSTSVLENLQNMISDLWQKLLQEHPIDLNQLSRQIQDGIYQNRKASPLVFDWFYRQAKNQLEAEMNYSVEQLVTEYNNRAVN